MPAPALDICAITLTSALGRGVAAQLKALLSETSGLKPCRFAGANLDTHVGEVEGLVDVELPKALRIFDCRNNRLAELTLQQDGFLARIEALVGRYGAHRVGLFIGTSTSGLEATERAYQQRSADGALPAHYDYHHSQNTASLARYLRERCGVRGIGHVLSTACSSSAKVFASARRAIAAGLCDAALVGGVDSLCLTTLYGFNALQLLSKDVCRPADAHRSGLSLGEAGGFALLEWADARTHGGEQPLARVVGIGESSDAHHMSAPDPQARGAIAAMQIALHEANIQTVDFINLHGTATPANDLAEDRAIVELLGSAVPCASTKGWTGHCLGAAGIVEAVFTTLCLGEGWLPRSLNTRQLDPSLRAQIQMTSTRQQLRYALSNSFGFGGTNCSLLIEAAT